MSRWIATVALILPLASLACGELRTLQVRARAGGGRYGGTSGPGDACEGRSPHGFNGVEAEVAAGIARFVRGEKY